MIYLQFTNCTDTYQHLITIIRQYRIMSGDRGDGIIYANVCYDEK